MSIKTSLDILTSGHPAANAHDATSRRAPLMLGLLAFATLVSSAVTAATLDNVSYISLRRRPRAGENEVVRAG
ncbi:MAG: hypothetical protein V9G12_24205 [Microthrixaceae bacterium]